MRNQIGLRDCWKKYLDWFHHNCHFETTWLGRLAQKTPFDAWVYQEIIYETKPTVIIEIGNYDGGTTIFLANILDSLGFGKIIGIDIDHSSVSDISHDRIEWITGDASSEQVYEIVKEKIGKNDKVMIIEDSSHEYDNTLRILELYSKLVSKNCYFIVEDGICKEEFIEGPKPGPFEAIHEFLKTHHEFQIDKSREKFYFTYNIDGFLKKIDQNNKTNLLNTMKEDTGISKTVPQKKKLQDSKQIIQEKNELLVKTKKQLHKANIVTQEKDKLLKERHSMLIQKNKQLEELQKQLHKANLVTQEKEKLLEERHKMILEKNKQLEMITKELERAKNENEALINQNKTDLEENKK